MDTCTKLYLTFPLSIWKLSDLDRDDHLSLEEYSIARFLVEEVKKGRVLPKELPSFLLPVC